ncbi:MAG: SsrA-binding protein SmpB [Clostridia bacterium]|nr:SsrA-binding protein SmpB [Clostridia bacterium]
MADKSSVKIIAQNKKAYHDYFVEEKYEAGIELFGTEVKSIRAGKVNVKESYCDIKDGEVFVLGMHISPYEQGNVFNKDPLRPKKLLLHKREILKLFGLVAQKGYTLVPLQVYLKNSRVKVEIGLCRGKKLYDKRDDMARNDAKRDMERAFKSHND